MPSECRFRDDGTKATRFYKPDAGDDRMKENDEDVVHAGIVSKSQKITEFRPILEESRGNRCLVEPATVLLPAIRGKAYRRHRSARIRHAAF